MTASDHNEAELLTTAEVAAIAKVSTQTVRRWRYDGDLDSVRLGYRTVRHRRSDVTETIHRLHRRASTLD